MSSHCRNDCRYCAFGASRKARRHSLSPDELASEFEHLHRGGLVKGLFNLQRVTWNRTERTTACNKPTSSASS